MPTLIDTNIRATINEWINQNQGRDFSDLGAGECTNTLWFVDKLDHLQFNERHDGNIHLSKGYAFVVYRKEANSFPWFMKCELYHDYIAEFTDTDWDYFLYILINETKFVTGSGQANGSDYFVVAYSEELPESWTFYPLQKINKQGNDITALEDYRTQRDIHIHNALIENNLTVKNDLFASDIYMNNQSTETVQQQIENAITISSSDGQVVAFELGEQFDRSNGEVCGFIGEWDTEVIQDDENNHEREFGKDESISDLRLHIQGLMSGSSINQTLWGAYYQYTGSFSRNFSVSFIAPDDYISSFTFYLYHRGSTFGCNQPAHSCYCSGVYVSSVNGSSRVVASLYVNNPGEKVANFEPYYVGAGNVVTVSVGGGYFSSHSCNGWPREAFPTPSSGNCMGVRYEATDVLPNSTRNAWGSTQPWDLYFKTKFDINNFHKEKCLFAVSYFLNKIGNPTDNIKLSFREDEEKLSTYKGEIVIPASQIPSWGAILTVYTKRCRFLKDEYEASYRSILFSRSWIKDTDNYYSIGANLLASKSGYTTERYSNGTRVQLAGLPYFVHKRGFESDKAYLAETGFQTKHLQDKVAGVCLVNGQAGDTKEFLTAGLYVNLWHPIHTPLRLQNTWNILDPTYTVNSILHVLQIDYVTTRNGYIRYTYGATIYQYDTSMNLINTYTTVGWGIYYRATGDDYIYFFTNSGYRFTRIDTSGNQFDRTSNLSAIFLDGRAKIVRMVGWFVYVYYRYSTTSRIYIYEEDTFDVAQVEYGYFDTSANIIEFVVIDENTIYAFELNVVRVLDKDGEIRSFALPIMTSKDNIKHQRIAYYQGEFFVYDKDTNTIYKLEAYSIQRQKQRVFIDSETSYNSFFILDDTFFFSDGRDLYTTEFISDDFKDKEILIGKLWTEKITKAFLVWRQAKSDRMELTLNERRTMRIAQDNAEVS